MSKREVTARETLDAIRLAIEGAADDTRAFRTIKALMADAPPPERLNTESVRRLMRAFKRVRRLDSEALTARASRGIGGKT